MRRKTKQTMTKSGNNPPDAQPKQRSHKYKSQWHPVFFAALALEFQDYLDDIEIKREEILNEAERRIDAVIIIVKENAEITKNIAAIFKKHNIFEYKSPSDYIKVRDFLKAQSYALQYSATKKYNADLDDITLSLVCARTPAALFRY